MSLALWFAGLVGLMIAAAVASGRGRATPTEVAGRGVIAAAAAGYCAVVAGAVWLWGGATARDGRADRLREGAAVVVAIDGVHVPLANHSIGHAAAATVRVPGAGPDELARVAVDAGVVTVHAAGAAALRTGDDPAAIAKARGCTATPETYTLPEGAAVVVVECDGDKPVRAVTVRRAGGLAITPLVAQHGAFVPERRTLRAGDALRLGGAGDAIPGLVTWDVIAPRDAATMLAIPADPVACAAWSLEPARAVGSTCAVTAGAFALVATPVLPDADAVVAHGLETALVIGLPPLLLLCALVAAPRRGRRARALARALRTCALAGGVIALACWRLLWAHRIDVLREAGTRVADNRFAAIAIGAAFAGCAVLALDALDGRSLTRRVAAAVAAWAAWLVGGALVIGVWPAFGTTAIGVVGLSLVAALAPVLGELGARLGRRVPVEVVLVAIAGAAVLARATGARGALAKLGLAYATVLAGHAALRALLVHDTSWARRARLAVALVGAAGAVALLDAGVALAIVGVGLALAMLVAGHDAMYDASQAGKLGMLEREHARLLVVHGAATAALAIGVATAALAASDRALLAYGVLAAMHAPLVAAGMFALAAGVARSHRRSWAPWLAAALAALAVWGARAAILERVTDGSGVGARRVAAVVEPGYALLRDDHAFVSNATAWREAALVPSADVDPWRGQGYFGARVRDTGVAKSIDNDYLPVLVARETGVGGLMRGVLLLLVLVVGGAAIASVRLRHASREHRARWLVTAVAGALAVYQPLAALGVLPLTGISWPGLGIDSPADIWLFVIGMIWCFLGADGAVDDERVRGTPRLARARRVVLAALVVAGVAAVVIVARAGACALVRSSDDDTRVATALRYASSLECAAPDHTAATLDEALSPAIAGKPADGATARFERELHALWQAQRGALVAALAKPPQTSMTEAAGGVQLLANASRPVLQLVTADAKRGDTKKRGEVKRTTPGRKADPAGDDPSAEGTAIGLDDDDPQVAALPCPARAGAWRMQRDGDACVATLSAGWPEVKVAVRQLPEGVQARCSVALPDDAVSALRTTTRGPRPRIRVVSAPLGAAADDAGELTIGARVVRLRAGAPERDLAALAAGAHVASSLTIDTTTLAVRATPRGVVVRGAAELYVAEGTSWRRTVHAPEVVLDRLTLIAAGPPDRRAIALFRPARAWAGAAPVVDTLLADTAGDRTRRIYPYGAALPELGWVNPYAVERSLGLDGWIHAAQTHGDDKPACGTLAPPAIARDRVCTPSPLDGVLECRVALQPQLALALRELADRLLADPKPLTGRDTRPVRVAYVALRGDTGEILAQSNVVPGRGALAFAPVDAAAEAELVRLRGEPGEADGERVEWNLPIAVGSTFKPVVARAAEQAFPQQASTLTLTAAGHASGCRRRRGTAVDPIVGHCPPTSVAGQPTTADLHEFLARSPNWFMAALGVLGLGMPAGELSVKDARVTLTDVIGSDLASWPADSPLVIADAHGPILGKRGLSIEGMRRTPLWGRIEGLLGRPICTLGDRRSCERAAQRADVCAARGLPIAAPGADLRNLVALGPDRLDPYGDDRPHQASVPVREYFQLLRGSGVHAIGSLAQITDAFGRVVYDSSTLAASWFPAPAVGVVPSWSCAAPAARANAVLGAGGGLCAVVQPGGTAHAALKELLADTTIVVYGAKSGTIDSLADIARSARACRRWNAAHVAAAQLECGRAPPDDSLFVIAFGVVTPHGTIPITLGIQLQRAGKAAAARSAPAFIHAIARYLRG